MSIIKALSALSLVLAALWLIIPKGKFLKDFKYAIGIFLVASLFSLFITVPDNINFNVDLDTKDDSIVANAENINNNTAQFVIEQLLNDAKIKFKKIEIITDKSYLDNIDIIKAKIILEDKNDFTRAAAIIEAQTGITATGG